MKIRLSQIAALLGALGTIFLLFFLIRFPLFIAYIMLMLLPGFLLTYSISKTDFSFLERLTLSLPLANIFLIIPRALSLLGIPFGKETLLFITIGLPILISLPNLRFFSLKIKEKLAISQNTIYCIFVFALAIFLCWLVWGSLLQGQKLPLTDQVVQFAWTKTYANSVTEYWTYPYWVSEWSGGFPISIFEASFYYERTALNWLILPSSNLVYHMNAYSFINLVLLLIGAYCLARRLGWGKTAALLVMALFITSPLLGSKLGYSGDMKEMTSFAIFPLLAIAMLLMLEKKELRYYVLFGILAAAYYFTNLVPLIPSLMVLGLFFVLYKVVKGERPTKREIIGILALGLTTILLIGFNLAALAASLRHGTPESWIIDLDAGALFREIIKPMFSDPLPGQYSHNMGIVFGIAAIAGMAISLARFRRNENYFLLGFWLMLLCYIIPLLKLPLTHVETHRLVLLALLVFAMFIGKLFDNPNRYLKAASAVLFIVLISINFGTAKAQADSWVNEQAQNGMFEQIYRELDKIGPGRAINYGIFAYATEPLIPVESDSIWMITHTTMNGAKTIPQYELKDGSESALNTEFSLTYILNRMKTTFTRYIIVVKDPGRQGDITYARLLEHLSNSSLLFDSQQLAIFIVPDSYYVQSVMPVKTTLSSEEVYSEPEGWKVFWLTDQAESDLVLDSVSDIKDLPEPEVYGFRRVRHGEYEITGNFSGEWIVIKDHYFPTWKAEMEGKELRIEESNLGTILIKTEPGLKIHLYHEPYLFERILSAIATIFIFACFLLVGALGKYKEDKKIEAVNGTS